jgi:hypothetical protein
MSGSGKPGSTFKAVVTQSHAGIATIVGEAEDIAYLVPGTQYLFHVTAVGSHGSAGSDESAPDEDV